MQKYNYLLDFTQKHAIIFYRKVKKFLTTEGFNNKTYFLINSNLREIGGAQNHGSKADKAKNARSLRKTISLTHLSLRSTLDLHSKP